MLSNFSAHAVLFQGILYPTSEHAYQASKFTDQQMKQKIQQATSPLQAKRIAHDNAPSMTPGWHDQKVVAMEAILREKLSQHTEVAEALIKSGTQEIIEDSPVDAFWGRGADHNGQNQLGKLWMKLRGEIIASH